MYAGSKPSRFTIFSMLVVSALGVLALETDTVFAPELALLQPVLNAHISRDFSSNPPRAVAAKDRTWALELRLISSQARVD